MRATPKEAALTATLIMAVGIPATLYVGDSLTGAVIALFVVGIMNASWWKYQRSEYSGKEEL